MLSKVRSGALEAPPKAVSASASGGRDVASGSQVMGLDSLPWRWPGIEQAESICRRRGVSLTPNRKAVLQTLIQAGQPLGAYQILEGLNDEGRNVAPPTVYRALQFLMSQRLIARLESMNAYVPCSDPGYACACVFFICEVCGVSSEVESQLVRNVLDGQAETLGFEIEKTTIELQGKCASCSEEAKSDED